MKLLRDIITNTLFTFSVLSIVFGILCRAGVLENLPYDQVVFTLLLMSFGTAAFVTLRELLAPNMSRLKYIVDIAGCGAVIVCCARFSGWLELSAPYFLMLFATVLTVYLSVWLLTWLQSKRDEESLNRLLKKRADNQENGK